MSGIDIILKDRRIAEDRIKRALKVLSSWPTDEMQEEEGFCWRNFFSGMGCAARDILEGNE